jgi:uncharacterized protein YjbJ (UPF0337 family)
MVDTDRLKGMGKQAAGSVKEAIGKVVGDKKTEAEGSNEKNVGKIQNAVGGAKDAIRQAVRK